MHLYIQIGEFSIPTYGLMIVIGVVSANLLAIPFVKRYRLDSNDFIILEAYAFLGGFLGGKLLYFWVSRSQISWDRMLEADYFNEVMRGGFVFYGGLIGGVGAIFLAGKLHHINASQYIRKLIFFIPWIHCFGRVGCFLAGCCYGKPYNGLGAVVFPKGSLAPAGISLFPVQLAEAACLMLISVTIMLLEIRKQIFYTLEMYIISYAVLRFILEYFRYDDIRGAMFSLSTSQWISMILFCWGITNIIIDNRKRKYCSKLKLPLK